ncbi:hypothetical protein [Legionella nagasakiensis]|uniref:hypothetical protein n=1 Tax=Legionella nagasakiensis TaxID=535290 RepID=UPI00105528DF|nr:hypothetical protein [Legionella nagasakiensis]
MMNIRDTVRQVIRNTFNLSERDDMQALRDDARVKYTTHLPELISLVTADRFEPKVVAEKLEAVVLHIKMEDEQTESERKFLREVARLVYEPQYTLEASATPEEDHSPDHRL